LEINSRRTGPITITTYDVIPDSVLIGPNNNSINNWNLSVVNIFSTIVNLEIDGLRPGDETYLIFAVENSDLNFASVNGCIAIFNNVSWNCTGNYTSYSQYTPGTKRDVQDVSFLRVYLDTITQGVYALIRGNYPVVNTLNTSSSTTLNTSSSTVVSSTFTTEESTMSSVESNTTADNITPSPPSDEVIIIAVCIAGAIVIIIVGVLLGLYCKGGEKENTKGDSVNLKSMNSSNPGGTVTNRTTRHDFRAVNNSNSKATPGGSDSRATPSGTNSRAPGGSDSRATPTPMQPRVEPKIEPKEEPMEEPVIIIPTPKVEESSEEKPPNNESNEEIINPNPPEGDGGQPLLLTLELDTTPNRGFVLSMDMINKKED